MAAELEHDPVAALREQAARYRPDRHPLQHATAHFHLGGLLLERGALADAETSFTTAAALFGARGARPEQAKALNGLGATLRAAGRPALAARAFEHAAAGLAAAGLALEEGAARFNLGLVLREDGRAREAVVALQRAGELLEAGAVPAQAAAAARELGATLLQLGDADAAVATLERAVERADRARDTPALAAAANALGLAHLAAGRCTEAVQALRIAAAASPRGRRPDAFAMAQANLALAFERTGAPARARLAARQALGVAAPPPAVRDQAQAVLARLGPDAGDLRVALEQAPEDERAQLAREELARTLDAPPSQQAADLRAWLDAHVASSLEPVSVAELWLGALLELPAAQLDALARGGVAAAAERGGADRETFRDAVTRAMARFHVPQLLRLQDVFSGAAADVGDPGPWR